MARSSVAPPNRLELFGGGALHTASGPIGGRAAQRHRIALLALLATTRRLHRSRDQLITLLWPDTDAERGRRLLSDSIYRINRALGGDALAGTGDDVRLNRHRLATDVADFEAAVDVRDWARVVALYAGPFLDGFYLPEATEFDQWMELERAQYARSAGRALEALATEARDAGRAAEAAEWWQRRAALVPDDSRVAVEVMRALDAAGNRAGALRHARAHTAFLRDTLGLEPDGAVRELAEQLATVSDPPAITVAAPSGSAIAVLPFGDAGEGDSYFADGVSEELMHMLTRTPGLRVASRTSSFAYRDLRLDVREVARRLKVDWVLEGSVRRAGDRLRIAAHLADAATGYQVWSESFERTASDLFAIQAEIARAIADRVAPSLGRAAGRASAPAPGPCFGPETCDLYFRAQFHWHRRTEGGLRRAAELFEEIVEREPDNARAWAGFADVHAILGGYDYVAPRVALPRSEEAARRAIALDPSLAGPYATLAYVDTYYHWNWESAERGFLRAIEIEPTNSTAHQWYADLLTARGRFDEAEREARRAAEVDPLSMSAHASVGLVLTLANDNARAIRQFENALQLSADFCPANYWMGVALEQSAQFAAAVRVLRRSMELSPDSTHILAAFGHAQASAGDVEGARTILAGLLERERGGAYIPSYQIAKLHHALGDVPAALTRLEQAYADRAHSIAFLGVDPQLRPLTAQPRFQRLLERLRPPVGSAA